MENYIDKIDSKNNKIDTDDKGGTMLKMTKVTLISSTAMMTLVISMILMIEMDG